MPAALLGWGPEIAVVRTTFLKWALMFFTAGKYAIFPSRFLYRRAPSFCPHCSLYLLWLKPVCFYFCVSPCLCPLMLCRRAGLWPGCFCWALGDETLVVAGRQGQRGEPQWAQEASLQSDKWKTAAVCHIQSAFGDSSDITDSHMPVSGLSLTRHANHGRFLCVCVPLSSGVQCSRTKYLSTEHPRHPLGSTILFVTFITTRKHGCFF